MPGCQGTEKKDQDRTSCIKFMHLGHLMHASAVKLFELALKNKAFKKVFKVTFYPVS